MSLALEHGKQVPSHIPDTLPDVARAQLVAEATMKLLDRACAAAVPRVRASGKKCPAYWWTTEIADLRKKCLHLPRLPQRSRRRDPDAAPLATDFKAVKWELKRAIKVSRCRQKLAKDLNSDPWGLGYKTVTRKLGAFAQESPRNTQTITTIDGTLFPTHPKRRVSQLRPVLTGRYS